MLLEETAGEDLGRELMGEKFAAIYSRVPDLHGCHEALSVAADVGTELRSQSAEGLVIAAFFEDQLVILAAVLLLPGYLEGDDLVGFCREVALDPVGCAASWLCGDRDLVPHAGRSGGHNDRQDQQRQQRNNDERDGKHRRPVALRTDQPEASQFGGQQYIRAAICLP